LSDADDGLTLLKVPEPNTAEMINLLGELIDGVVDQLPFNFSHGDLMSALMYSVIEAGLASAPTPEKLRADLIDAVDRIIPDVQAQILARKGGMN
jgi:hypothetical protein